MNRRNRFIPAFFVFLAILPACRAGAATLNVPSTDYGTIQSAIDAAVPGDTVAVAAGTYSGAGNWDIDFKGKAITVQCTATAPETCTIDCLDFWHRGFFFRTGEGNDSVLDGFTVSNAVEYQGGAIWCVSASPTITNCKFTGNQSKSLDGGAIYCSNASPIISDCTFSANTSVADGGAIYCNNSSPAITGCVFNQNSANFYGGAVFCEGSSNATISGCSFANNSANLGAGVACKDSSPTILNCTFETNTANVSGGGICCVSASPQITGCTLTANSAARRGGGISCEVSSAPTISNCDINTNSAPGSSGIYGQGGGIYSSESSPSLSGCNITGNVALSGAGIFSDDSSMTIQNCVISLNNAGSASDNNGGGIYVKYNSPTIGGSTISGNTAYDGGGIYCYSSYPTVYGTIISGNTAVRHGGGVYGYISYASFASSTIQGNDAEFGGGIRIRGELVNGTITVVNCVISGNTADYGAGIDIYGSSPVFVNNTVFGNAAAIEGGGVRHYSTSLRPELINTIFWADTPDEIKVASGPILVEYCNVQGGHAGSGNIDGNPLFKDAGGGDFHLTAGSPCIDAGTSLYAPEVDYEGTPRWDDPGTPDTGAGAHTYYDIGAFEFYPACIGDVDPDGDVDGRDLALFMADYLAGNPAADLNGDGDMNAEDVAVFAGQFGKDDCADSSMAADSGKPPLSPENAIDGGYFDIKNDDTGL